MSSSASKKLLIPTMVALVSTLFIYSYFSTSNGEPKQVSTVATSPIESTHKASVQLAANQSSNTIDVSQTPPETKSAVFSEGSHFITKFPNEAPKKPVIVEFFSYMCPHCFNFEGTVLRWKKQKPASVELLKIPVTFGREQWRLAAKSYYIAEELNMVEKFSAAMFRKIHLEKKPPKKESDLAQIFATLGVDEKSFKKVSSSFNVDAKLRKADFLAKKFMVKGVPYFLINYKYEIGEASYQSEKSLFNLWNNLPGKDFK